jgi:hypothetical protein
MSERKRPPYKAIGIGIGVVGLLIALVSLLADVIGIGSAPLAFGYKQMIGTTAGSVLLVLGVALYLYATPPRQRP